MRAAVVTIALLAAACTRPAEERALADLDIGRAEAGGARFAVAGGLATVRSIADGELVLYAQAPALHIDVELAPGATVDWRVTVLNAMPDAELLATAAVVVDTGGPRPTARTWTVTFDSAAATAELDIAPPDAALAEPYRFAYMADIQEGVDEVGDLFARMNADPSLRFVVAGGDLVHRGDRDELVRVLTELEALDIPFYTTIGNHELWADDADWEQLIGARNFHFAFRGVHFSLVDSGSATLDPLVYDRLEQWLDDGRDAVHLFITHYPPIDPVGVRQGGFRSRKEAAKLFSLLADAAVDTVLVGHIHSYYAFDFAGIPVYVSGGGGAYPRERLDGIERHFLSIDVTPTTGLDTVDVIRVD